MIGWTLVLLAGATALAAQPGDSPVEIPASETQAIPFEIIKGHIYVHARVNGKGPYLFVFDTGASGMGRADVTLVKELGLPLVGQEQNSDGINVRPINVVTAGSLGLGAIEKRNVELLSRDYNANRSPDRPVVSGILGADFFADHLLTIDYPSRTLKFSAGALRKDDPAVFAYDGNFRVPVCFSGGCRTGMVDTGSSMTIVIPKDMVGTIRATTPVHVGTGRRANTVSNMFEMDLLEPVRIGAVEVAGLKIRYADPSGDEVNVGTGFLKDYVLTIDSRNKLLRIERPAGTSGERG